MFLAAIFCLLWAISTAERHPNACCVDREFECVLGEIGGSILTENGIPTKEIHAGYNILHYDYYVRKMAVESHIRQNDGTMKVTHLLYDFNVNKTYITSHGVCNVTGIPPSTTFREPCISDDAKFLGSTYIGYGDSYLPLHSWELKKASHPNITKRMSVTQDGCTPIMEATFGYVDHTGNKFDIVYVFNNYHPRIRRRDVFDVPHACHPGQQSDIPESANRDVRRITNLFA